MWITTDKHSMYNMNILAIDFGTKNIGLAWTDTGMGMVLPYGRLENKDINKLVKLIKDDGIDKVVMGLPMGLNGKENVNTNRVHAFAEKLGALISVPIEFANEMFSSQMGDRMGEGVSRDEKAAMVILEDYIHKRKTP